MYSNYHRDNFALTYSATTGSLKGMIDVDSDMLLSSSPVLFCTRATKAKAKQRDKLMPIEVLGRQTLERNFMSFRWSFLRRVNHQTFSLYLCKK